MASSMGVLELMVESCRPTFEKPRAYRRNIRGSSIPYSVDITGGGEMMKSPRRSTRDSVVRSATFWASQLAKESRV